MAFKIQVNVSVSDSKIAEEIGQVFQSNFGDLGNAEPLAHYVERKTEEWILNLYANKKAEAESHRANVDALNSVKNNAEIKQRIHKSEE